MKKSLLALAALTAFAGAASAQSSVTLFGIVDVNVRTVDNDQVGSRTTISTSGNSTARLGFRGVEDLGGGLRAGFWIEGQLDPDTGNAGGQTWQRRSTVSLMGGFGEIRLGRDYTPTFWNHTVFDPFGTNGVGSQNNLHNGSALAGSTATTFVRANNTVGYFLPALGGLYGQIQIALDEGATPGNEYQGGRIGYAAGPVNVAVAYGVTKLPVNDLEVFNIGASFNMGFMTLMGQAHQYEFGNNKQMNYLIGVTVPMGPGTFKASYGLADDFRESQQFAVGYVYDLSKRTALYTHAAFIDNDSGANFVISDGKTNGGNGFESTGFEFGIRHSF